MAEVLVSLRRQDGPTDEECGRFLWCLLNRIARGREFPIPDDPSLLVAPLIQDVTLGQVEDLDAARNAVIRAAASCDPDWEQYYRFAGAQPAPPPESADRDDDGSGEWKGYAPLA
jgi:hypothetical protein